MLSKTLEFLAEENWPAADECPDTVRVHIPNDELIRLRSYQRLVQLEGLERIEVTLRGEPLFLQDDAGSEQEVELPLEARLAITGRDAFLVGDGVESSACWSTSPFLLSEAGDDESDLAPEAEAPATGHPDDDRVIDERPFTVGDLPWHFDERGYLEFSDLLLEAARLVGDGQGGDLGENREYERGIVELLMRRAALPAHLADAVLHELHTDARALAA